MKYVCPTMENFKRLAREMDIVVFGAGKDCMRFLNHIGDLTDRVKCIMTNNKNKIGSMLYGIPIVSADVLKTMDEHKTLVVIAAGRAVVELYDQVLSMGDYIVMASGILLRPIFSATAEQFDSHREEIKRVSEMLYDDLSKKIYRETIRRQMLYGTCDFSDLEVMRDIEYCPTFWFSDNSPENEVIIDCGALTGGALKRFVTTYGPKLKRVYSFECMPQSVEKLKDTVSGLSNLDYTPEITVFPYALSDYEGTLLFAAVESGPSNSFVIENRPLVKTDYIERKEIEVNVSTIDKLIPKDEKVTQIKMDIEGSEYKALLGARETILRCKPKLAVSIYHSGEDYYRLPLLVKEMVPEYKIAIRHYGKNQNETDMYCWI